MIYININGVSFNVILKIKYIFKKLIIQNFILSVI